MKLNGKDLLVFLKGNRGAKVVSTSIVGATEDNYIYEQCYDDGTKTTFTIPKAGGGGNIDLSGYVQKSTEYPEAPIVYGRGANYENFSDKAYVITHIPSWGNLVTWGDPDNVGADNGIDYNWGTLCCPVPKQPYQTANRKFVEDTVANGTGALIINGEKYDIRTTTDINDTGADGYITFVLGD